MRTQASTRVISVVAVCGLLSASAAGAQQSTMFVPVEPCRLVDTRVGGGPPIAAGETRTFSVADFSGYGAQGGSDSDCGTTGARIAAVAVNVVAANPSAQGNLLAFPTGETPGTASTLNFPPPSVPLNIANAVIVPVGITPNGPRLSIRPTKATHVVIDVTGYFTPLPLQAFPGGADKLGPENLIFGTETSGLVEQEGSTISGGYRNAYLGSFATIPGGRDNVARDYAAVVGGRGNLANGPYSVAAGRRASIDPTHDGSFLFADSTDADFASDRAKQFKVRAGGGARFVVDGASGLNPAAMYVESSSAGGVGLFVEQTGPAGSTDAVIVATNRGSAASTGDLYKGFSGVNGPGSLVFQVRYNGEVKASSFTQLSDRNAKQHFEPTDPDALLRKLAALPISTWAYKGTGGGVRHMGPMAQDFREAFGLGEDERHIATVDADGVALAAIQALHSRIEQKDSEIAAQKAAIERMERRLQAMEAKQRCGEAQLARE